MKLCGIDVDLLRGVDLPAIAYIALSAPLDEGAPQTGPVPSADVFVPSSNPSTPTGDTAPELLLDNDPV